MTPDLRIVFASLIAASLLACSSPTPPDNAAAIQTQKDQERARAAQAQRELGTATHR